MGRRKGLALDGWLIVDKPAGPSSAAVVNKVRWALGAAKAGHAGTLDPAATGLLAVALGEATKTIGFVEAAQKAYDFRVRWGQSTDTDDAEGQITATRDLRPDAAAIRAALPALTGDILQRPPAFSAVKVAGERAYTLARAGEQVELAPRPLHVAELTLRGQPDADHADFRMVCGKGGYVRAIGRDLGLALGCLGHVLWLRRVWSGPFDLDGAVTLEEVEALAQTPALAARLLPLEVALAAVPAHPCPEEARAPLANGNAIALPGAAEGRCWISDGDGRALALGHVTAGRFQPDRLIVRP